MTVKATLVHGTTPWVAPFTAPLERLATSPTTTLVAVLLTPVIVRHTREARQMFLFLKTYGEIAQHTLTEAIRPLQFREGFGGRTKVDKRVIAIALLPHNIRQTPFATAINADNLSAFAFQELDDTLHVGFNVLFGQLRIQDKNRFVEML
jgi:hypothetical protein